VLRFCWELLLRTPLLLWESAKLWVEITGVFYIGVGIFGLATLTLPPLWTGIPVIALFLYGFMRAIYERVSTTEKQNEELSKRLAIAHKRKAVKDLLGDAVDQGKDLRVTVRKEGDEWSLVGQQDVEEWVHRTHDLIEAAFDKGEARRFLDSADYMPEKPLPYREIRVDPYKYHLEPRLQRLNELIVRANELEINPDLDPQE
jgi:hypothetical protein